jgi:hypothetical protein
MTRRRLGGLLAGMLLACGGGPPPPASRVDGIVGTRARALRDGGLSVAGESLDDALLLAILDDPRVPELVDLELFDNALTAAGVRTLLTHAKTAQLRVLHLGSNPIGDDGVIALAESPRLTTIERLEVGATAATAAGIGALARSPHAAALRLVQVGYQPLGDPGAVALVALRAGALLVKQAAIGGPGARALLAGTAAGSLVLDDNPLGAGGLIGLAALAPEMTALSLQRTALGAADAAALAALPAPALRALSLTYAPLGDDGVRALLGAPWFPTLRTLDLTGTRATTAAYAAARAAWGERPGFSGG